MMKRMRQTTVSIARAPMRRPTEAMGSTGAGGAAGHHGPAPQPGAGQARVRARTGCGGGPRLGRRAPTGCGLRRWPARVGRDRRPTEGVGQRSSIGT